MAQSPAAQPSDWNFAVGAGVAVFPRYPGAKAERALPLPVLSASYKDIFFADTVKGLGVQTEVMKGLTVSAAVGASIDERKRKDNPKLAELHDISAAPALVFGTDYVIGRAFIDLNLSERIGRQDRKGGVASLDLGYNVWNGSGLNLGVGATAQAMDKTYAKNFFGIDAAQAAASGLPVFDAKAGLKDAGLFAQGQYKIDDHWSLSSRVAFVKLAGNANRSPVVERMTQPSIFLTISRAF